MLNHRLTLICSLVAAAGALTAPATAELLLYEGFDYDLNASLAGQAGGYGFDAGDAWNVTTGGGASTAQSIVAPFAFSDFPVAGNAFSANANTNPGRGGVTATRRIGAHFPVVTGSTLYVSFLARPNNAAQDDARRGRSELLFTDSAGAAPNFRSRVKSESWETTADDRAGVGYNGDLTLAATELSRQSTYLVIAEYTNVGVNASQQATIWFLTPAQYDAIKAGGITTTELSSSGAISSVDYAANEALEASDLLTLSVTTEFGHITRLLIDEVRVMTSLTDIYNVPEPASLAMAAVALATICARRRA